MGSSCSKCIHIMSPYSIVIDAFNNLLFASLCSPFLAFFLFFCCIVSLQHYTVDFLITIDRIQKKGKKILEEDKKSMQESNEIETKHETSMPDLQKANRIHFICLGAHIHSISLRLVEIYIFN